MEGEVGFWGSCRGARPSLGMGRKAEAGSRLPLKSGSKRLESGDADGEEGEPGDWPSGQAQLPLQLPGGTGPHSPSSLDARGGRSPGPHGPGPHGPGPHGPTPGRSRKAQRHVPRALARGLSPREAPGIGGLVLSSGAEPPVGPLGSWRWPRAQSRRDQVGGLRPAH